MAQQEGANLRPNRDEGLVNTWLKVSMMASCGERKQVVIHGISSYLWDLCPGDTHDLDCKRVLQKNDFGTPTTKKTWVKKDQQDAIGIHLVAISFYLINFSLSLILPLPFPSFFLTFSLLYLLSTYI